MSHVATLYVVTFDKPTGNLLAGKVGPEPGDATTFDRATPLFPVGTVLSFEGFTLIAKTPQGATQAPVAWFTAPTVKQSVVDLVNLYNGPGPYDDLAAALEIDAAQIPALQQVVHMQLDALVPETPDVRLAFIAALGLTAP